MGDKSAETVGRTAAGDDRVGCMDKAGASIPAGPA